jgi:hypothetical protein
MPFIRLNCLGHLLIADAGHWFQYGAGQATAPERARGRTSCNIDLNDTLYHASLWLEDEETN